MAEDRMLNDEILLGLIKANSGGGGGGTTDYDDLSNKPQIGGVTLSGDKSASDLGLATTTDLAGKQDILTFDDAPADGSNNPVKSNGIYDALALKQNATDNNLDTTAKTIVGAINEHEGDIVSLKSGLTNLDNEVNGDATVYPYADVITIEDAIPANVADCSVKIEPVQDLHGQSAPYVGGAGKNKMPLVLADLKTNNTDGTWNDNVYTINNGTITVNTDDGGNVTSIKANGTFNATTIFYLTSYGKFLTVGTNYTLNGCTGGAGDTYKLDLTTSTVAITTSTTGDGDNTPFMVTNSVDYRARIVVYSGVTVSNQMFYPMIRLATETDATFAPYSNICPISGHTEASVQRDGRNLIESIENGTWDTTTQTKKNQVARARVSNIISVLPTKKYTFSIKTQTGYETYVKVDYYAGLGVASNGSSDWQPVPYTCTIPDDAKYATIEYGFTTSTEHPENYTSDAQFELGETATTYAPYVAGKTYTIALGDTIYGGTVRIDSNGNTVMDVDRAVVDMGDLSWTYNELGAYFSATFDGLKISTSTTDLCKTICEAFEFGGFSYDSAMANRSNGTYWAKNSTQLRFKDNRYTDATNFETAVNGVHVLYELATPTTIQLTPQQIQLLQGTNTLTASTGQISVTVNGVSGSIGSVQEQVNELAEEVAEIKPLNYSTTEQETGQKWIDGKDIYQRSFDVTFTAATTNWTLFDNSVSYDKLINVISILINENGEVYPILQDKDSSPRFHSYNNAIEYYTQLSSTLNYVITLQYTKATT